MNRPTFCILAVMIILLGAGLRLPHLATRSLWFDEALAANNSAGTLSETVANTRTDNSSPILYPLLLYAVEKVRHDAIAVRIPAFVSGVLLIILVVVVGKRLIGAHAALMAGLVLAVTSSQIRYAQEVREYALSVFAAGVMTYSYLDFLARPSGRLQRLHLWAMLALAPLIQYGLVLYGCAILMAISWIALKDRTIPWRHIVVACACLGVTGLFSLLITLRYQWGIDVWYLNGQLFVLGRTNPVGFFIHNTVSLLTFLTPGRMAFGLVSLGLALLFVLASNQCNRAIGKLLICTGGIVFLSALCHAYPFGGVRQCLYLAPLVIIAAVVGLAEMASRLGGTQHLQCLAVIATIFAVSGASDIKTQEPYEEIENSKAILGRLAQLAAPTDDVYIFYGARPAVQFYTEEEQRKHFIFGGIHRERPEQYSQELLAALHPGTDRVWLVLSHINFKEDLRMAQDLETAGWLVTDRLRSTNAALFEASRAPSR